MNVDVNDAFLGKRADILDADHSVLSNICFVLATSSMLQQKADRIPSLLAGSPLCAAVEEHRTGC